MSSPIIDSELCSATVDYCAANIGYCMTRYKRKYSWQPKCDTVAMRFINWNEGIAQKEQRRKSNRHNKKRWKHG